MLIARNDVPGCETDLVDRVVEPFEIWLERVDIHCADDLLNIPDIPFDYVYVCGRANESAFGGRGCPHVDIEASILTASPIVSSLPTL